MPGEFGIVGGEEAPDVGQPVFLGRHGAPVGMAEHLVDDVLHGGVRVAWLTELDHVGVFREATRVQV